LKRFYNVPNSALKVNAHSDRRIPAGRNGAKLWLGTVFRFQVLRLTNKKGETHYETHGHFKRTLEGHRGKEF
jgi:hypothetical protein